MTDYFSKAISRSGNEFYYDSKEKFISDLCKALQTGRKEQNQKKMNPYWFNKRFDIKHLEEWHIQIAIYADKFKVLFCEAVFYTYDEPVKVRFCCNSEADAIFKNITEFREFLNREVMKGDV